MSHPWLKGLFLWVCRRMQVLALHIFTWYLILISCLNKTQKIGMFLRILVISFSKFRLLWSVSHYVFVLTSRVSHAAGSCDFCWRTLPSTSCHIFGMSCEFAAWPYSEMLQIVLNFTSIGINTFQVIELWWLKLNMMFLFHLTYILALSILLCRAQLLCTLLQFLWANCYLLPLF